MIRLHASLTPSLLHAPVRRLALGALAFAVLAHGAPLEDAHATSSSARIAPAATAAPSARTAGAVLPAPMLAGGGTHSDKRFGFKFLPPKGWNSIAMKTDEAWLTAKYVSDKTYFYTDPKTRWTSEHTPELLLIAFIR
ncbi:MAG: hypothetical protein AAF368_15200, partial [Planctomycetota bacterium]